MPAGEGPRVSILMPVYNAQRYLRAAMESMLAQRFADFEFVCVDDGSTDDSLSILKHYAMQDGRIRIVSRRNTGFVGALNDGLAVCRGPYIARMDADDTCHPDRLGRQVAFLDANPDHVAVACWQQQTDPYGSPAGILQTPMDHEQIDAALIRGSVHVMPHPGATIRRDTLLRIGGWREFEWVDDLDLFLRLAEVGRLSNIPAVLHFYRRHLQSACFTSYERMCMRIEDVLREAYARRGIAGEPNLAQLRPDLGEPVSAAEQCRLWACHALNHRRRWIACRHSVAALRRSPGSRLCWRTLAWCLAA